MSPKGAGGCYGSAGARYPLARPLRFYNLNFGSQEVSPRSPGPGALVRCFARLHGGGRPARRPRAATPAASARRAAADRMPRAGSHKMAWPCCFSGRLPRSALPTSRSACPLARGPCGPGWRSVGMQPGAGLISRIWPRCRPIWPRSGAPFTRPTWMPSPPSGRPRRRSTRAGGSGGSCPRVHGFGPWRQEPVRSPLSDPGSRRPLATGLTTAFAPQGTRPFHLEGRCGRRSMRRASGLHPLCVVWKGVDVGNLARLREHLSVPIVEFELEAALGPWINGRPVAERPSYPLTAPYQFDIARTASGASEVGTLP